MPDRFAVGMRVGLDTSYRQTLMAPFDEHPVVPVDRDEQGRSLDLGRKNVGGGHRAAAAALASVTLVAALVGCTKTATPAAPSPTATSSPSARLLASASAAPGGDFSDGDN